MGEETITVGNVSRGDAEGTPVELPIVDLLTGRGFVTGKSGSGKSNSASVVAEKLLDRGYSLLAVDIDGEYYGLKEEYEILHVGGDEECDLQVTEDHAGKIAELALEGSVPIILDVSSFLDESKARDLLTAVTKHLFAKGKKQKQPFLMLVEEIHEYIPEGGGLDECGRMLIKISKRGRKHGLGIVGISQRPADVKKDFITQCDWLVWHRLTWNNDTKVVGRILGSEYANYIEEMNDGECFLMTDWAEEIRPVQFERKRTFDAGATPGLDDFERPELKSVSGDLVEELQGITDERERRENRVNELERELEQRDERIRDLERQLSEARDLKRMADRFSRAMMEQVTGRPLSAAPGRQSELEEAAGGPIRRDPELEADLEAVRNGKQEPASSPVPDAGAEWEERTPVDANGSSSDATDIDEASTGSPDGGAASAETSDRDGASTDTAESDQTSSDTADDGGVAAAGTSSGRSDEPEPTSPGGGDASESNSSGHSDDAASDWPNFESTAPSGTAGDRKTTPTGTDPLVSRLREEIEALDETAAEMLEQYRNDGPMDPQDAHAAAGGSGDRGPAYATNRRLRQRGLISHVGCGQYDYALAELVATELSDPIKPEQPPDSDTVADVVAAIEAPYADPGSAPEGAERTQPRDTDAETATEAEWSSIGL